MNARSLKSIHYSQGVENSARYNLHCFQDLVYTEDLDIVLVNETWLHRDMESSELLHSVSSIYRNDREKGRAGGVMIAVKSCAFKSVTEYPLADELSPQLWSQQRLIRRFYSVLVTGLRIQTLVGYIYLTSF